MTSEELGVRDRLEKEIEQVKADDAQLREKLAALIKVSDVKEGKCLLLTDLNVNGSGSFLDVYRKGIE